MDNIATVEALLDSYCKSKLSPAHDIDPRYAGLWKEIHQYLMHGGKRMRPRLVLFAHEAYGSADATKNIMPIAAAWELLHACVLVHDDIIDRDEVRHGQLNIAGKYQSIYSQLASADTSHYALSAALIGGDLLLMSAYEMINSAAISSDAKILAQTFINKALFTVAGGELIDTDAVLYPVDTSNPNSIATHKTASYSLQLPLMCGAALAGAPEEELEKLSQIGLHAGVAYQLRDDLLGVFGDSNLTGKSNRSDILEKKRTLLIHKTIEQLENSDAKRLLELFTPDHAVSAQEAEEVVELILSSGAKMAVERDIIEESNRALEIVKSLNIHENHKNYITELITNLTARTS